MKAEFKAEIDDVKIDWSGEHSGVVIAQDDNEVYIDLEHFLGFAALVDNLSDLIDTYNRVQVYEDAKEEFEAAGESPPNRVQGDD